VGVGAEDTRSAARAYATALAAERDLGADAEALATFTLTAANPKHAPRFTGKTSHERRVLLDALPPPPLPEATWALCRRLIEQPALPAPGSLPDCVREALERDPRATIEALRALVPSAKTPALTFREGPALRGLHAAASLCTAAPALAVACIVSSEALAEFLSGPESRTRALVREGRLDLDAAVAPESGAGAALATLRRLEEQGAPDAQRALHAEASRALFTGADDATPDRARSKAERFLYEQLKGRPSTAGLFLLNEPLRVEGASRPWEVDLLCRELRLAVEIDGHYHFHDPDRFRRDRRKDLALQRAGYWVVRVLEEDVLARLEDILDTLDSLIAARRREAPRQETPHGHR
jgi:very-short-patch-repair endonuclease